MPQLSLHDIENLCKNSLLAAGASEDQAAIVAAEIAEAEARRHPKRGPGLYSPVSQAP